MDGTSAGRPHVVIIGGGFGGLECAKALRNAPVRVTLIDRSNHHLFQPLLYQVATAGLSPSEIAIPIRSVLRQDNCRTLMAAVVDVDTEAKKVVLDDGGILHYDDLVVAAGAVSDFFGNDHWAEHALPLKTVEDATRIRRNFLLAFERAERLENARARRKELTFVVIGGGPTGVEVAGAFAELAKRVLASDYRMIERSEIRVLLLEGGPRLLAGMSEKSGQVAVEELDRLGVEVRLNAMAKNIDAEGVHLEDELIETDTVIWAAGVSANPLSKKLGAKLDRAGRIVVNLDCTVPGCPNVFAIGDIAAYRKADGTQLPGVSPVAMQQGRYVARVIQRRMEGKGVRAFRYFDKGTMATIGRNHAVAETWGLKLRGFSAWLAWLIVHLWFLVGFKNRVFVLLQWVFSYVFYRRGARLITHADFEEEARRRRALIEALRKPESRLEAPAPTEPAPARTS